MPNDVVNIACFCIIVLCAYHVFVHTTNNDLISNTDGKWDFTWLSKYLGCQKLRFGDRQGFNTLRPRQDGHHFPDDILICIFLNENEWHSIKISLTFVPNVPINNIPALVQIMAWRRPGDKPLSEPMMVVLPTHICVTRPQWVKCIREK